MVLLPRYIKESFSQCETEERGKFRERFDHPMYVYTCLTTYLPNYLTIYLPIYLSKYLPTELSNYLSTSYLLFTYPATQGEQSHIRSECKILYVLESCMIIR
jgi:hypothetical protein